MTGALSMEVIVDPDILIEIEEVSKGAPAYAKTAYTRTLTQLRPRILRVLQVEPEHWPVGRKRRWTSERQRRAFFAKDDNGVAGFGAGIPYQRTGKLLSSYDVVFPEDSSGGAVLEVVNTDPKARFVVGDDAQPMHLDSGWVQMAPVVATASDAAADLLIDTWVQIADPLARVPKR